MHPRPITVAVGDLVQWVSDWLRCCARQCYRLQWGGYSMVDHRLKHEPLMRTEARGDWTINLAKKLQSWVRSTFQCGGRQLT